MQDPDLPYARENNAVPLVSLHATINEVSEQHHIVDVLKNSRSVIIG